MAVRPSPPWLPPPVASLYVGDLDPSVTEVELFDAFSCVSNNIFTVHLCRDFISGKSLRYAYVNFYSPAHAAKALRCLNYTYLKGNAMRIMWSQRNPLPRKIGIANLFVKNLDPSINNLGLYGIFGKFGNVLSCKVAEENGKSKGFGFVQFDTEKNAMSALNVLHGAFFQGKKLYVSKFVRKNLRECAKPNFRNLYVKNLDHDVTEEDLRGRFSEFGKVCSVFVMKDDQGISKGFGFICFESAEDAKKAVESMNGVQLVGTNKVSVGRAQKKGEREQLLRHRHEEARYNQYRKLDSSVYVKNLDESVDDKKLKEHFDSCGTIISSQIMCHHDTGLSKGFGFIRFSTSDEAKKAVATLNGTVLQGKSLHVALAQRKEDLLPVLCCQEIQYPLGSPCSNISRNLISPLSPPICHHPPIYEPSHLTTSENVNMKKYMLHTYQKPTNYITFPMQKDSTSDTYRDPNREVLEFCKIFKNQCEDLL